MVEILEDYLPHGSWEKVILLFAIPPEMLSSYKLQVSQVFFLHIFFGLQNFVHVWSFGFV